ncbi:hypothetical protein [Halodesulfovibrio marinisediminis]|uniref:Uncharacterized protein n=1 Tax=Halodesulfovibrio marinisediminis DSM 17456 TaxID=1121457 RepID=A0A1N6IXT3_9BACT|nr:hypothetical protein [Halodesulfovibrio marinisediminis]SIO36862.1 hypothetical protein SAMN02745161_3039 [Halodesulfovibrio marinisediminis DSM 17456]
MSAVTVIQNNFNGGELSPLMGARTDQVRYGNGCTKLHNMLVLPHGPALRRPGFQFIGKCRENTSRVRLIPFSFNVDQTYILEFGNKYIRVWKDGGLVVNKTGTPIEIGTPWTSEMLDFLSICQSADVLFIASSFTLPHKLCRGGHALWYIEQMVLGSSMKPPINLNAQSKGIASREYSYVVTAIDPFTREESEPSEAITFQGPETISVASTVTLTWQSEQADAVYAIYKCWNESGKYGFVGHASSKKWVDRGATPDFSEGYPVSRKLFQRVDEYPSAVQFYQQRLCFAATRSQPQTIWMSRSGSYTNFNISDPLRDDDGIAATLAAERVNKIEWMVPGRQLIVGTAGSEWSLSGGDNKAVTPSSIKFERQSTIGAAPVPPLVVGESILFLQQGGKVIREFLYSLQKDGYMGTELSILSEHLLKGNPVVSWAYQQEPYSVVWCVLSDGSLAAFTYEREHDVVGWHRHVTEGKFESVCCIKGSEGDELWCVVTRNVNGAAYRYVERLAPYSMDGIEEQFFVDSGVSYRGEKTATFSGLDHLEGKSIQILADGFVIPPQVVSEGRIILPYAASVVHAGLQYSSELIPTEQDVMLKSGSSRGRTRRVNRMCLHLYESSGVQVGVGNVEPLPVLLGDGAVLDATPALFSGETVVEVNGGYEMQSNVLFRQEEPLPFTLLSYSMQVEIGER